MPIQLRRAISTLADKKSFLRSVLSRRQLQRAHSAAYFIIQRRISVGTGQTESAVPKNQSSTRLPR